MSESIEDIIRRIVREELAAAPARQQPSPLPAPGYFPVGRCAFCGGWHDALMCPQLQPTSVCTGQNLQN